MRTGLSSKRLGIIGTGNVAGALGAAWHDVVLGSREPGRRSVAGQAAAAAHGEVIVNATPGTESPALLRALGPAVPDGKVLLDPAVGFQGDGRAHPGRSLGEILQEAFPRTAVVKTLCTVTASVMADPGRLDEPGTLFPSGDEPGAKRTVAGLLGGLGRPEGSLLDLGGIATARGQEHFALLFLGLAGRWARTSSTSGSSRRRPPAGPWSEGGPGEARLSVVWPTLDSCAAASRPFDRRSSPRKPPRRTSGPRPCSSCGRCPASGRPPRTTGRCSTAPWTR